MKKFFKGFHKGQKGFTLIELLVVIAILGVLAAVVIPNVAKFIGSGDDAAAATELSIIHLALTAMQADSNTVTLTTGATRENDFSASGTVVNIVVSGDANSPYLLTDYLISDTSSYWYTIATDGTTVEQFLTAS